MASANQNLPSGPKKIAQSWIKRRQFGFRKSYGEGSRNPKLYEKPLEKIRQSSNDSVLINGLLTVGGQQSHVVRELDTFNVFNKGNFRSDHDMNKLWKLQEIGAFQEPEKGAFVDPDEGGDNFDVSGMGSNSFGNAIMPVHSELSANVQNFKVVAPPIVLEQTKHVGGPFPDHFRGVIPAISFQPGWTAANGVTHLNVTTVGDKTGDVNKCCISCTYLGLVLIFPIFFICCMWWRRIASAKYVQSPEVYRAVGRFCRANLTCRVVNLKVADNQFDADKARILYDGLIGTAVTSFNFINMALAAGGNASNFRVNIAPLKDQNVMSSTFNWGDMSF